jgi:hypothetical protein
MLASQCGPGVRRGVGPDEHTAGALLQPLVSSGGIAGNVALVMMYLERAPAPSNGTDAGRALANLIRGACAELKRQGHDSDADSLATAAHSRGILARPLSCPASPPQRGAGDAAGAGARAGIVVCEPVRP